jgi:hypothetical protein
MSDAKPVVKQSAGLWFFPTRGGQWEVYAYMSAADPEVFVGVENTRQEAYTLAQKYARDNGIPFEAVAGY